MQHAKRLFLVDEFDRVYKCLQHPAGAVAKGRNAVRLNKILKNSELHDHEKARQYVAELHQYLNRKEITQQPQQQQPSVQKIAINTTTPNASGTKKKKKKKTKKKPVTPEKYSTDWSRLSKTQQHP